MEARLLRWFSKCGPKGQMSKYIHNTWACKNVNTKVLIHPGRLSKCMCTVLVTRCTVTSKLCKCLCMKANIVYYCDGTCYQVWNLSSNFESNFSEVFMCVSNYFGAIIYNNLLPLTCLNIAPSNQLQKHMIQFRFREQRSSHSPFKTARRIKSTKMGDGVWILFLHTV